MSFWTPTLEWRGQPAYILGGGPSLREFEFSRISGRNVIGVNDAFRLGGSVVRMCLFGDASWFHKIKWDLEKASKNMRIVSVATSLATLNVPWIQHLARTRRGLNPSPPIGYNLSTGAAAVNLAILLGATSIYLLGFDISANNGRTHWHNHNHRPPNLASYARFLRGFDWVHQGLSRFPHVRLYNVTNGGSKLVCFPRIPFADFLRTLEVSP